MRQREHDIDCTIATPKKLKKLQIVVVGVVVLCEKAVQVRGTVPAKVGNEQRHLHSESRGESGRVRNMVGRTGWWCMLGGAAVAA